MADRIFGVSTRLFRDTALTRDHLVHIAAHGFDAVELYAGGEHFDYRSEDAAAHLGEWLGDTRLVLQSVHAPANSSLDDLQAVLSLAQRVPYSTIVVHRPAATEKTLVALSEAARAVNVRVAIEARQHHDSSVATLVQMLEDEALEGLGVGLCFDFGHAHLEGDVGEALETASGHVFTTHVHDNSGRRDERLVPYTGRIPWDAAMMEVQKIGYDGPLIFEYGPGPDPVDTLARSMKARGRLEQAFITF